MYTRVIEMSPGDLRLLWFARTDIKAGQELTYNYRYAVVRSVGRDAYTPVVFLRVPHLISYTTHVHYAMVFRFNEEEGERKVPCNCGAPNCRGFLN